MSSGGWKLQKALISSILILLPSAARSADDDVKRGYRCMMIAALSYARDTLRTPQDIASEALLHCEEALDNASFVQRERIMDRTRKYIDPTDARNIMSEELEKQTIQLVIESRKAAAIEGDGYYEKTARNIALAADNE